MLLGEELEDLGELVVFVDLVEAYFRHAVYPPDESTLCDRSLNVSPFSPPEGMDTPSMNA